MKVFYIIALLVTSLQFKIPITDGAKILIIFPFETRSMRNLLVPYVKALNDTHHQITILGMYKPNEDEVLQGINELALPGAWEEFLNISKNVVSFSRQGTVEFFENVIGFVTKTSQIFLKYPLVQSWVNSTTPVFDLAIINGLFGDFALPIGCHVASSCMVFLPPEIFPWIADLMNMPFPTSYAPWTMLNLPMRMSFGQRILNFLASGGITLLYESALIPYFQSELNKEMPHLQSINESWEKIVVLLTCVDPVIGIARPSIPQIINIGCIHCKTSKPLKGELERFINSSGEDGFILFSLGSIVKASSLSPDVINKFISVFKTIKQNVVWKFEKDIENLPSNVKIFRWLPQQDILSKMKYRWTNFYVNSRKLTRILAGHPKIRLFITHAGLLSLEEAVYHGVPVICFPVAAEQPGNAARVGEKQIGEVLDIHSFSKEELSETIHKILYDQSYSKASKKWSLIARDQSSSPMDRALYWTNYAIRHKAGNHMRISQTHLNYFQKYHLDVFLVISTSFFIFIVTLRKCVFYFFAKVNNHSKKDN